MPRAQTRKNKRGRSKGHKSHSSNKDIHAPKRTTINEADILELLSSCCTSPALICVVVVVILIAYLIDLYNIAAFTLVATQKYSQQLEEINALKSGIFLFFPFSRTKKTHTNCVKGCKLHNGAHDTIVLPTTYPSEQCQQADGLVSSFSPSLAQVHKIKMYGPHLLRVSPLFFLRFSTSHLAHKRNNRLLTVIIRTSPFRRRNSLTRVSSTNACQKNEWNVPSPPPCAAQIIAYSNLILRM